MALRCDGVVLCRGMTEQCLSEDRYSALLRKSGYNCYCLYCTKFEFVNISDLHRCLRTPEEYHGLLLTSKRAIEAINKAINNDDSILQPWKNMIAYCVGPATQSSAEQCLLLNCTYTGTTNTSSGLATKICNDLNETFKPLLYPCSAIARESVQDILSEKGIKFHKLVVYRTIPNESLETDLLRIEYSLPKIFVFFSPSTVKSLVSILKKYPDLRENIKAVAIGPVTKESLVESGFIVYGTALQPEPNSLLEAINDVE